MSDGLACGYSNKVNPVAWSMNFPFNLSITIRYEIMGMSVQNPFGLINDY